MIRLLVADLRQNARTWAWTFVVAAACGAAISSQFALMTGGLQAAKASGDQDMKDAAVSLAVTVMVFVGLSALAVLTSTSRLAIEGRWRDIGLWRALGMKPRVAGVILMGEMGTVGAAAGIVGSALAIPCARVLKPMLVSEGMLTAGTDPALRFSSAAWCALIVAGTCVVSGWFALRGALRADSRAHRRSGGNARWA